jgi:hypothetical protein
VLRNPALALALAAAVTFLVGGIAIVSWFAVAANREKTATVKANQELTGKNAELDRTNVELERKTEELEATFARAWLMPLATQPGPLRAEEPTALNRIGERCTCPNLSRSS